MSLTAALAVAMAVVAQSPDPRISIYSPAAERTASGPTELWADVDSPVPVTLVVFRVDGREVARFREPPYQLTVDLGAENLEHRFEVLVRGAEGELGRAERVTPALRVDEEIDLELRQLYVTVERRGSRVLGLSRADFRVVDDGEPQEIVTFEGGDAPLAALLLVDASLSMKGEPLRSAVAGARTFMSRLQRLDEASLVLFSDRTLLRTDFAPPERLRSLDLGELPADGGTALNDQLYLALEALEARQGRRVVIVLTDGIDVHSALDAAAVQWKARRSRSMVYWIELSAEERGTTESLGAISPWRDRDDHDEQYRRLLRLVEESGGRRHRIGDASEAPAVFEQILRELREQYVLGYYPTSNLDDGSWHAVTVRLTERGLNARTRAGYLDAP